MLKKAVWLYFILSICFIFVNCSGDSGNNSAVEDFSFTIEDQYNYLLGEENEQDIYNKLQKYNQLYFRANVLVNSTIFADMYFTPPGVVKYRAQVAEQVMSELTDLAYEIAVYETQTINPIVEGLSSYKARFKAKSSGDTYHAWKLIDLYMNDDAFYKKYKLSDISRRTQVSITRLRMMMSQIAGEIEVMGYDTEAEAYATGVRNMKAIRDTAVAAEGALVTFATGGATAGTMGTFAKGVIAVEKANAIISCTEATTGLINASMGTDEIPPTVQKIFTGNKVLSYVLLPKALAGKDAGSVIAMGGPIDDLTDYYFNVSTDTSIKATGTPQNPTTKEIQEQSLEKTVSDMLLPGSYNIPKTDLNYPNKLNTGFEFNDEIDLSSMDELQLEAAKLADLWDLPGSPTNNYTWDTEQENPDSKFINVSSIGFPDGHPFQEDEVLSDYNLTSKPTVSMTVDVKEGDAPLYVTFTTTVNDSLSGYLTYSYHHGDGGYEQSASQITTHTYTEAGTYTAMVYVEHPTLGSFASNTITITVNTPSSIIPDGDIDVDSDQESIQTCAGLCSQALNPNYCFDRNGLCYCGDDSMWQYLSCDTLCLQYGYGLPSECGLDGYGYQSCLCSDPVDGDIDNDIDTDTDGDTDPGDGTWTDDNTGLMWENPDYLDVMSRKYSWQDALDFCENLVLNGYDDWRAPTIDELRSLIRGCPATETGGTCPVTSQCLDYLSCKNDDCQGCTGGVGPGWSGAYLDPALEWPTAAQNWYWSSQQTASSSGSSMDAWVVHFGQAMIWKEYKNNSNPVRCVR